MDDARQRLEKDILARIAAKDHAGAATVALRGYGPDILGFLYRTTKDDDVGDDVFSQFSEDLWAGIGKFEGRSSVKTWLFKLAWHAACRHWSEPWSKRRQAASSGVLDQLIVEVRSQTGLFQRTAAKEWLAGVKEDLKAEDVSVLTLRLEQGLPLEEIAEVLGSSHEAVRQRWSRLKKRLAKLAQESGLAGED